MAGAVAAVLVAGGAGYLVLGGDGDDAVKPAPKAFAAAPADRLFALDPAAPTDGHVQELTDATGDGALVIAVGGETGGSDRGRFLVSADGGRAWRPASVRAADGTEPPPGEVPRRVAGATGRWVALGGPAGAPKDGPGPTIVWTSADGRTWTRRPPGAFAPQDRVLGLARVPAGFVAVGASGAGDQAKGVLWTSVDGVRWQRADRLSLGDARSLDRVVASGAAFIVDGVVRKKVTKTETKKGKKRKVTRTVEERGHWRSTDGGRTWAKVDVPQAQGSFGGLVGLTAGPGGFFAARDAKRTTGPKKRRKTTRHGVVWSSPDGGRWTTVGQIQAGGYAGLDRFAGSSSGLAALVRTGGDEKTLLRGAGRTWQPSGEVAGPEVTGMAVVGSATVVTGRRGPDPYLFVPGVGEIDLKAVPGAINPQRDVAGLVSDGPVLVAFGGGNGEPAAWVAPDGRSWRRATGLGADADPGARRLTDVVRGEAGWLAVGRSPSGPLAFTSPDATGWSPSPALPGKGSPSAAAYGPRGYVAVGQAAPWTAAWHSSDLKKWKRVEGGGEGRMRDVVAVADGFTAVGSRPGDKGVDRPAAWTSTDGEKWSHVPIPALPPGLTSGSLDRVVVSGATLVAVGTGATGGSGPQPFVALSGDGGKTWQTQVIPGAGPGTAVTALTATPRGYVMAGTTGAPGDRDVAVWAANGRLWRSVPARGGGLDGRGDQSLTALAASGTDLVAVGVNGDHRGDHPTFWRRPLP
ncbi:hypothetical protein [Thermomonospora umbrina]|uniref:hypothetical protein n=1 Tax=Thermomonospora umbrina TaxID=111806 RepID=UPI000E27A707|nr:hypothetical protein [Thermomonospora umbrina]